MARVVLERLHFIDEGGEQLRVIFARRYEFLLSRAALERIAPFSVVSGALEFDCAPGRAERRLRLLVSQGMRSMRHLLTKKPTLFIDRASAIPLIGSVEFGLCERGTNTIEVKPLTGCNLNCIFCSVDEGRNDKRIDILIDDQYLVEEFAALAAIKVHPIEANIGPHGEPLLYPFIVELIGSIAALEQVATVSINTNGVLLTRELIDRLASAGLTRINLSLHALDQELADRLYGAHYPLAHVLEMIEYAQSRLDILLTPVVVPGMNEGQIVRIVELGSRLHGKGPHLGIQNFLDYKRGRNPVKPIGFDEFGRLLTGWERETGVSLALSNEDFNLLPDTTLPRPFRKGDLIEVRLVAPGRYPMEMLGVAGGRVVTVLTHEPVGRVVRARILRDKHNIFYAKA